MDPWELSDRFTAGDPDEIYAMARGFRDAAERQGEAVTLTTAGLDTTATGYQVGNATPVDVEAEVAQARQDMGGGGEKLGQIARILSDVASDLAQRATGATGAVSQLESDLAALATSRDAALETADPADHGMTARSYDGQAVQKVRAVGEALSRSVLDYEEALAGHVKAMADLGYVPPTTMDEGPVAASAEQARLDGETLSLILSGGADGWSDDAIEERLRAIALRMQAYADDPEALRAFYNAAGDAVLDIPDYLDNELDLPEQERTDILRPLGNGLLALSNLPGGEANIPEEILDHLYVAENVDRNSIGPDGHMEGADTLHGLAELLEASTIQGDPEFVAHVGEAALQMREELDNAVVVNTNPGGPPGSVSMRYASDTDADSLALLDFVGTQPAGAQMMVDDADVRRELLTTDTWSDGGTAAGGVLYTALSDVGADGSAERFLAVAEDVMDLQTEGIAQSPPGVDLALADATVLRFDELAEPAVNGDTAVVGGRVSLTPGDLNTFLQYVESDDTAAAHLQQGAAAYQQHQLVQAMGSADPDAVPAAGYRSGTLFGAIEQARADVLVDRINAEYDGEFRDQMSTIAQALAAQEQENYSQQLLVGTADVAGGPFGGWTAFATDFVTDHLTDAPSGSQIIEEFLSGDMPDRDVEALNDRAADAFADMSSTSNHNVVNAALQTHRVPVDGNGVPSGPLPGGIPASFIDPDASRQAGYAVLYPLGTDGANRFTHADLADAVAALSPTFSSRMNEGWDVTYSGPPTPS